MIDLLILFSDELLHRFDLPVSVLYVFNIFFPQFAQSFVVLSLGLAAEHLKYLCLKFIEFGMAVLHVINALGNSILKVAEFSVEFIILLLQIFVYFFCLRKSFFLISLIFLLGLVGRRNIRQFFEY